MQPAQIKKLYENALSYGQSMQSLQKALNGTLRLAITDHSHFDFLLHNINWFTEPYFNHIIVLEKALRVYRGLGKHCQKVAYNILADGMWLSNANQKACTCLLNIIKNGYDQKLLKESLKQNYPHKVVQLQMQINYLNSLLFLYENFSPMRLEILQIIMLELASFDTELCAGDQYCFNAFPPDSQIKNQRSRIANNEQYCKFDILITNFIERMTKLSSDQQFFTKLLLIFKNHIIHVDQTKYIQLIVYYFAQQSKKTSKDFLIFLFSEIVSHSGSQSNRKIFASLNYYLVSYILRSILLFESTISKTMQNFIALFNERRKSKKNERQLNFIKINLGKVFEQNFDLLVILQTIIQIWVFRPLCRQFNRKQFEMLLENSRDQIYYEYFISHELLREVQFFKIADNVNIYKYLQMQHKFNPPILKKLSLYMDPITRPFREVREKEGNLKIQYVKSEVKQESIILGLPVKRVKSQKKSSQETNT